MDYCDNLNKQVIDWGLARNIIQESTEEAQLIKLEEEFNELKKAISTKNSEEIADAIGDMTVVLIMMSEIFGKRVDDEYIEGYPDDESVQPYFELCLEKAYDVIKDRKGKLINGVFVKEADL